MSFLTGANRGIGRAFVDEFLRREVGTLYAAVRDVDGADLPSDSRIVPIRLDLADRGSIEATAAQVPDVNVLINNAGYAGLSGALSPDNIDAARHEMEVNYFGPLQLVRALRDTAVLSSEGAIINVGSYAAYVTIPSNGTYCASKAAFLALTRTLSAELKQRGTRVYSVLPTQVNTEMVASQPGARIEPEVVAVEALDAIGSDLEEVYPGERGKLIHEQYRADPFAVQLRMSEARVDLF